MFGLDLKDARLDLELLGLVVDLLRLLAEGEDRKDSRDDGEHGEHRCSYGGELGREDERHGGRLRGGEPLGAASLELGSGDVGPRSRFRVRKLVLDGREPGVVGQDRPGRPEHLGAGCRATVGLRGGSDDDSKPVRHSGGCAA